MFGIYANVSRKN